MGFNSHNLLCFVAEKERLTDMITIFFDGLCRPRNPGGVATYGYVIYQDTEKVNSGYGVVGSGAGMTNNVAEYAALKHAVEWVCRNTTGDEIVIKGDSRLVIHQMNGTWQVKSETSKKFVPENPQVAGRQKNEICLDSPKTECGGRPALKHCISSV